MGFKIKQPIIMFSESINHRVGLIICCIGCIAVVVVKIGQPTIVRLFKLFILILWGVSGGDDNGLGLGRYVGAVHQDVPH